MRDLPVWAGVVIAVIGVGLLAMARMAWQSGYGKPGNTSAVYQVVGGTVAGSLCFLLGVYEVLN